VQLVLLVQQDHKVQPVQQELQDRLEAEAAHLGHKVQLAQQVQLVRQALPVQLEQRERQVLQEQMVPQVQQVLPELPDLLAFLKLFMERWQFQISTEWQALRRMERLMDSRRLKAM
jgi:hypothetical protein